MLGFLIMVLTSFAIGAFARRRATSLKSFFYGGKDLNVNHIVNLILSTSFSMNGMIYQTWLGYSIGWSSILIQVIWCISYVLLAKKAAKVQMMTNQYGTLHGSISSQFGVNAGKIAAIATVIGFTMQVGWELIVGTALFSSVSPHNKELKYLLIFALAGIGGIYTIAGGLKGNLKANIFQNWFGGLAMMTIIFFLIFIKPDVTRGIQWGSLSDLFFNIGIVGFITNAVFSLSWQFVDMTNWQNLAAGKEGSSPKKALWWSAVWVLFFPGVVGTVLGMLIRNVPNLSPDNIFEYIVNSISAYPVLLIFLSAGFIAAMLSTIDGLMLASGQVVTWDLTHHNKILKLLFLKKAEVNADTLAEEKKVINITRYWIFGLGIFGSFLFSWITISTGTNIFDLVYIVVGAQMVLLPSVLSILFGKNEKKRYGFASILSGLITVLLLDFIGIAIHDQELVYFSPFIKTGADILPYSPLIALIVSAIWSFRFNAKTSQI